MFLVVFFSPNPDPQTQLQGFLRRALQPSVRSYIDAFKYGSYPHAGAGIGMERVVMSLRLALLAESCRRLVGVCLGMWTAGRDARGIIFGVSLLSRKMAGFGSGLLEAFQVEALAFCRG